MQLVRTMEFDTAINRLKAAQGDSEKLVLATVGIVLAPYEPALRMVLEATAIPHWFDSKILANLLNTQEQVANQWVEKLRNLPMIESFATRGGWNVHEATRLALRNRLHHEEPARLQILSERAALCFKDNNEPIGRIEEIYHTLLAEPEVAVDKLERLWKSWRDAGRYESLQALGISLGELLTTELLTPLARARALLCFSDIHSATLPLRKAAELTQEALALFHQLSHAPGEADAHAQLGDILKEIGDLVGALSEYKKYQQIILRLIESDRENTSWQCDLAVSHNYIGSVFEAQGRLAKAQTEYQLFQQLILRLIERDPDNADWQHNLAVSHNNIGNVLQDQGSLNEARDRHQAFQQLMLRLTAQDPDNTIWQCELAVSHSNVGSVLQAQGRLAEAQNEFQLFQQLMLWLTAFDPDNTDWQRDLAASHGNVGSVLQAQGRLAEAQNEYQLFQKTMLRLTAFDPDNTDWQRDLAASHSHVGSVLEAQGRLVEALGEYETSKQLMLQLTDCDPDNTDWQHDLAVSHNNVGNVFQAQGLFTKARDEYEISKQIRLRLVDYDPDNSSWKSGLAASYSNVGYVLQAQGRLAEAQNEYQLFQKAMLRLTAFDPDNTDWQRDLAASYSNVGSILQAQGRLVEALGEYETCKQLMLRLIECDPDNTDWQHDLAASHGNVGGVLQVQGQLAEALNEYEKNHAISKKLITHDPTNAQWQKDLSAAQQLVDWLRMKIVEIGLKESTPPDQQGPWSEIKPSQAVEQKPLWANDSLFNQVVSILSAASYDKPWMTASYIARKIGNRFDGKQIEEMLLAYCRDAEDSGGNLRVRYSSLPSRRTLEVLWGAVEKVGSRRLENITQDHVADDSLVEFECLDQADVFVSHSHRDYTAVMAVAKYLLQNGVVPWLAETHIGQGEHIHEEIISALSSSQDFLLYLSPNALDSRWTGKEYNYALNRKIPIFIVADIDSSEIKELLDAMHRRDQTHFDTTEKFTSANSEFINYLIEDPEQIIETFAYSHASGIETQFPLARPLSELPNCICTRRSSSS